LTNHAPLTLPLSRREREKRRRLSRRERDKKRRFMTVAKYNCDRGAVLAEALS